MTIKTLQDYIELAKSKEGEYILEYIPKTTHDKVEGWKCKKGHVWSTTYHLVIRYWCPVCSGNVSKTTLDYKNAASRKSGIYILDYIPKTTKVKVEGWQCEKNHVFSMSYNSVDQGNWCPFCSGKVKKTIADYKTIAGKKEGEYLLDHIPVKASIIVQNAWKCSKGHVWSTSLANILYNDTWCPVCSGNVKKTLSDYQRLAMSKRGEYILESIPQNNKIPVKGWKCDKGHIWEANFNSIQSHTWCPLCLNFKSENLARQIILEETGIELKKKRPSFLRYKYGSNLELDGFNSEYKYAFEYQGIQHYKYNSFFHRTLEEFEYIQEKDKWKCEQCNENGVSLMLIPYKYDYRDEGEMRAYIKTQIQFLDWIPQVNQQVL